jgi:hypothetical protein
MKTKELRKKRNEVESDDVSVLRMVPNTKINFTSKFMRVE